MHLDLVLDGNAFVDQKLHNVASMVTLELDDRSPLLMLNYGTVAAPGLLECFRDFRAVQIFRQSLYQC